MASWIFLFLWAASVIMQAFLSSHVCKAMHSEANKSVNTMLFSVALFSMFPICTLLLFISVFVIGGASNVAQVAGEQGLSLWKLWHSVWPLLWIGNPISLTCLSILLFFPPYPDRNWKLFICRISAVLSSIFATIVSTMLYPTA
jgi:uncharacterized BrkB/YihY/UPF0761 family membrane protein